MANNATHWVRRWRRVRGRTRGLFQYQSHHNPHRPHRYWDRHKER